MKVTTRVFFTVLAIATIFTSQHSTADTCTDILNTAINDFNSLCSGTTQCYVQHPHGYGIPTGTYVSISPSSSISSNALTLTCKSSACPPYTYPDSVPPSQNYSLCNNLPYTNLSTFTSSAQHENNALLCGSIVGFEDQTLGESIPIKGAKFSLNYFSHFNAGRGNYAFTIPLTQENPAEDTDSFSIKVSSLDGDYADVILPNSANLNYTFTWNGKNKTGTPVYGKQTFKISFTQKFQSLPTTLTFFESVTLGGFNAHMLGIGGYLSSQWNAGVGASAGRGIQANFSPNACSLQDIDGISPVGGVDTPLFGASVSGSSSNSQFGINVGPSLGAAVYGGVQKTQVFPFYMSSPQGEY